MAVSASACAHAGPLTPRPTRSARPATKHPSICPAPPPRIRPGPCLDGLASRLSPAGHASQHEPASGSKVAFHCL